MSSNPAPEFHTTRTLGTGQSNAGDVRRLRRALTRTGYGRFGHPPADNVTPGLMEAIERFQSDFGLEPDSVIRPGGPTERALSMALRARNEGGEPALAALRDSFARHAADGLTFEPDPADRNEGLWRESLQSPRAPRPPRRTQVAVAPAIGAAVVQGARIAAPYLKEILRLGAGVAARQSAIEAGKQRGDERSISEPPPNTPPFPAEPPASDSDDFPVEPPRFPDRLETPAEPPKPPEENREPIESPKLPDKIVFTSLEDDEFWNQVSILRRWGKPQTQELNHLAGTRGRKIGKEYGCDFEMTHGGFIEDEKGNRKYQAELWLRGLGEYKDKARPLANGSYPDVVLQDKEKGIRILINTADTYARTGALKPREEAQRSKILVNMETEEELSNAFIALPKPRGKVDLEEYAKGFDSELRKTIKKLCTKAAKRPPDRD